MNTLSMEQLKNPASVPEGYYAVDITPELAEFWLRYNNEGNRKISPRTVLKYSVIMSALEWWGNIPDPYAYGWDGNLVNGQHRLAAILYSNTTQKGHVFFGADPGLRYFLDTAKKRTADDQLRAAIGSVVKAHYSSMVAHFAIGHTARPSDIPTDQIVAWSEAYYEHFQFVMSHAVVTKPMRGLSRPMLFALVARAHYHGADPDRLARFLHCITYRVASDKIVDGVSESAVERLWNAAEAGNTTANKADRTKATAWDKITTALWHFVQGNHIQQIRVPHSRKDYPFYPAPKGISTPAPIPTTPKQLVKFASAYNEYDPTSAERGVDILAGRVKT